MIKILHAADLHLEAPQQGLSPEQAALCRRERRQIPQRLAALAREGGADLVLLSGDLFDRPDISGEPVRLAAAALESLDCPVFIAPGNHDFFTVDSPYYWGKLPPNVHIFQRPALESLALPELSCRIYGAGYTGMDCPNLLEGFRVRGPEKYHILVLHGQVTGGESPYCPVSRQQLAQSGLTYAALGHVHKAGQLTAGRTLCAWPGCAMGGGFDETGEKGFYWVTLDEGEVRAEFRPLETRQYLDLAVPAGEDPLTAALDALPPEAARGVCRLTFTGEAGEIELSALRKALEPRCFALTLRDRTEPRLELWQSAGDDTLEGRFFALLRQAAAETPDEDVCRRLVLAARLSRRLLEGREVELP